MKILYLLSLVSLVQFQLTAQEKGLVAVYDSIYHYDFIDNAWVLIGKEDDFVYEGTNALEYFQYELSGDKWIFDQHILQTFDENGKVLSRTYIDFTGTQWQNSSRFIYNYHGDDEPDVLSYEWVNGQWKEYSTSIHYYDSNDNLVEWIYRTKMFHSQIENQEKKVYEYDDQGILTSFIHSYWSNNQWDLYQRQIFTYENGLTKSILIQLDGNQGWRDYEISLYHYASQRVDSLLVKGLFNGDTTDKSLTTYEYDAVGNLCFRRVFDKPNGIWRNTILENFEYTNNHLILQQENYWSQNMWFWNQYRSYSYDANYLLTGETWAGMDGGKLGDSTWYYFQVVTNTQKPDFERLNIHPNPTPGLLVIDAPIKDIEIYTITGTKIAVMQPFERSIDLSLMPKGVYILKARLYGKSVTQKILKI